MQNADLKLSGKTVIVTGAARGLGQVMAAGVLKAGANVVAMDKSSFPAEGKPAGDASARYLSIEASVADPEACEQVVKAARDRFGAVHCLINNAGIGMHAVSQHFITEPVPFWKLDPAMWIRMLETNASGQFFMARAIAPLLIAQGWGRIVNITTSYSTMLRKEGAPYGPSKAAVEASTAIWAKDLAGTGVTVNALLPGGAADTPAITDRKAFAELLDPAVMVAPAVWLCSDASDGVTGRRIIGKDWNPELSDAAAAALSSAPAAW